MSNSPRQDFHLAAFNSINIFTQIVDELSKHDSLINAHANAPEIMTNGRSVRQIILDDLMNAFITIMQDTPDADIPVSFYKQMMSTRNDATIDDATARQAMADALTQKRANPNKDFTAPEFMLLFNDLVPEDVSQNIVRNWVRIVHMISPLLLSDEALRVRAKTIELASYTEKLNNELLKAIKDRKKVLANILKQSNDPEEGDIPEGAIIHYAEDIEDIDAAMDKLVGLEGPKNQIKEIRARVKYKKALQQAGMLSGEKPTMDHYIFRGPPGTGKTTFGRMIGKIYQDAGLLDSGHVVEASADTLCAGFVRQTGPKTRAVVEESLGGVLFIDEAYSLFGTGNDFGKEALEVILRSMEVHKGEFIVVFAGYPDKIDELIKSNPGLTRRFKHTLNFDNFQQAELMEIFDRNLAARKMTITPEARDFVAAKLEDIKTMKGADFGNAGTVENIVDILVDKLALAVEQDGTVDKIIKLVDLEQKIPAKLKTRLTRITLAEAHKIELKNETSHAPSRMGFAP